MKIMELKKVKLPMINTCQTLQSCNCTCINTVFQEFVKENNCQIQKKTLVGLEIHSGVLVVNTNQCLHMQKAFCCIDKYEIHESYLKSIPLFVLKYFYPVIY